MDQHTEQSRFEIQSVIEQKPFENEAVCSFFIKWCEINDSIVPEVVDRRDWEQRFAQGRLEKRTDGKQTLYIPNDLQLWEMVGVMEVVDHDTFATQPERQDKAGKKVRALGKTFENTAIYIARRLDYIDQGRDIARALAEEFYGYGKSLSSGKKVSQVTADEIARNVLTSTEIDAVDRFLAGDDLYRSRQMRVEKLASRDSVQRDEVYEAERQRTLAQFFRVSAKAFALERRGENGELKVNSKHLKPWQNDTPFHNEFLFKIEKAINQKIEIPKNELVGSIFRRGMELLQRNMPIDKLPDHIKNNYLHWLGGEKSLRGGLRIEQMKADLETVRQFGDISEILRMEREITDKIQRAVSSFPYQSAANNPSEMVANQFINCVGASTLGGALMSEVGLNYLVGEVPGHSILFLATSDGHVEWRDMLDASLNEVLTNGMIKGRKRDGSNNTVADIIDFSKNPKAEGFRFTVENEGYGEVLRQDVTLFEPEYGQRIQVLNNAGNALNQLGRNEEAIEAYRQAIIGNPKSSYPYKNLGDDLVSLRRYEEAIEAYRKAIALNPMYAGPYRGLGNIFLSSHRYEEAIEAYRKAIAIDPKNAHSYTGLGNALFVLGRHAEAVDIYRQVTTIDPRIGKPYNDLGDILFDLGRNEEAIAAYRMFIDLADKQEDDYYIKRAKSRIEKFKPGS